MIALEAVRMRPGEIEPRTRRWKKCVTLLDSKSPFKALGVIGPSRSVIKTCEDGPCSRCRRRRARISSPCIGLLHSDPRRLDDPGIAVYFKFKKKQMVMARDGFISAAGNLRSLGLAIEGLRQLERHGGSPMLERAFVGFLALAPPDRKKPWREVFGIKTDWNGDLTELYREKARTRHPDAGGSNAQMAELNVAYEEGRQELGLG